MNKTTHLYHAQYEQPTDNLVHCVPFDQIDSLINYSFHHIYCSGLDFFDKTQIEKILFIILQKIRPEGLITVKITDMNKICRDYITKTMSDDELINIIKNKNAIISQNYLDTIFNNSQEFKTIKIENPNKLFVYITAQRIKI